MKLLSKITIVIGLIAFVSSCRKENTLSPERCSSHQENTATQKVSTSPRTLENSGNSTVNGEAQEGNTDTDEVVGGGDDDRDGGGKKIKKGG